VLLEVGPGRTLSNLARQHPAWNANSTSVSSLRHAKEPASDLKMLLNALGQLWLSGSIIDWKSFYKHEKRRRVRLPAYPFEHKRFWVEPAKPVRSQTNLSNNKAPDGETEKSEAVPIHYPTEAPTTAKEDQTTTALRNILEKLSGLNLAAISGGTTFTEMGFDSLFLTQASAVIEKQFGVRVAFRQLLEELSTMNSLAAHIRQLLPAEA